MTRPVVGLQARTVGVEDANEVGVDVVVAVICHDGGFGEALGLVVDGARSDGVDAAPIALHLWMDFGVSVALRGGCVEISGVVLACEVERDDGSIGADQKSFGAEATVVDGAGGRGEVEDVVDVAGIEGLRNVVIDKAEARFVLEMGEVCRVAGAQVVDADDDVPLAEQGVGKVGAEEACGTGDENRFGACL